MITLSNGHRFEYVAASGALAFDGLGWPWEQPLRWLGLLDPRLFTIVLKTLTREPRRGNLRWWNPLRCIRMIRDGSGLAGLANLIPNGAVNAVGLTNPGIEAWCRDVGPRVRESDLNLVGSILGEAEEVGEMARMLEGFNLRAIELNVSCPNTRDGSPQVVDGIVARCRAVKRNTDLPLILKLSVTHYCEAILRRVWWLVEAIAVNSVPWAAVFPNYRSPLARFGGGGVSGKLIQPYTWPVCQRLTGTDFGVPVIWPSIWDYEDIRAARSRGAQAVSFGSVFLRYPWRPTRFVRRDLRERGCRRHPEPCTCGEQGQW